MIANCVNNCLQIGFFTEILFLFIAGLIRVQNNSLVVCSIVVRYVSIIYVGNSHMI